ncbi:hypothetical protein FRC02_011960 [Tulasnella sp. 418]|nr:hypothetical protein FRC02_011960 [Tulasnella sp. 418]
MDPTKQDIYFESMMDYAHHAQTVRYFQVAAFSIVMYDWLMMMRTEIEYVWMKEWTLGTAMYAFTRYFGFAFQLYEVSIIVQNVTSYQNNYRRDTLTIAAMHISGWSQSPLYYFSSQYNSHSSFEYTLCITVIAASYSSTLHSIHSL